MANTVTESIYSSKTITIPMADVQHIERGNPLGLVVVTKHTRWDSEAGAWANAAWVDGAEAESFMRSWCTYRAELEADTLADLEPARPTLPPMVRCSECDNGIDSEDWTDCPYCGAQGRTEKAA